MYIYTIIYVYIALERNKPIRNSKILRVPQVFHHEKKHTHLARHTALSLAMDAR